MLTTVRDLFFWNPAAHTSLMSANVVFVKTAAGKKVSIMCITRAKFVRCFSVISCWMCSRGDQFKISCMFYPLVWDLIIRFAVKFNFFLCSCNLI